MYKRVIFLLSTLIALSACSPIELTNVSTYTLSIPEMKEESRRAKTHSTLALAMPTASPGFETANMLYVMTPFQLQSFTRNRWVAPPAEMLVPIMLQVLRATDYYEAIVPPTLLVSSNYRLNLQIVKLQQEFLLPDSKLRLEIEALLLDDHSHRVISSKQFTTLVDVNGTTPYAGVLATNRAVADLTKRIASWCISHS